MQIKVNANICPCNFDYELSKRVKLPDNKFYDVDILKNNNIEQLVVVAYGHYNNNWTKNNMDLYESLIQEAIKTNNIQGTNILWSFYYWTCIDIKVVDHIYLAAEHSNLKMFEHVLNNFNTFHNSISKNSHYNNTPTISINKIKSFAEKNSDKKVLEYVNHIFKDYKKDDLSNFSNDYINNLSVNTDNLSKNNDLSTKNTEVSSDDIYQLNSIHKNHNTFDTTK